MDDICPSCREPLDCPSGDGCAAMTKHIDEFDAELEAFRKQGRLTLEDITLDTDEFGIWLITEVAEGPQQLGHISWKEVARGVQQALLQEKFLIALAEMDKDLL